MEEHAELTVIEANRGTLSLRVLFVVANFFRYLPELCMHGYTHAHKPLDSRLGNEKCTKTVVYLFIFYLIHATNQSRHPQGICGKATLTKGKKPAAGPRPVSYNK